MAELKEEAYNAPAVVVKRPRKSHRLRHFEKFIRRLDEDARKDGIYPGLTWKFMMDELGVKAAVDQLLRPQPHGRFHEALVHLRLTENIGSSVEAWVIHDAFRRLFNREQVLEAESRLKRLGVSWDRLFLPKQPVQLIFVYHQTK